MLSSGCLYRSRVASVALKTRLGQVPHDMLFIPSGCNSCCWRVIRTFRIFKPEVHCKPISPILHKDEVPRLGDEHLACLEVSPNT